MIINDDGDVLCVFEILVGWGVWCLFRACRKLTRKNKLRTTHDGMIFYKLTTKKNSSASKK